MVQSSYDASTDAHRDLHPEIELRAPPPAELALLCAFLPELLTSLLQPPTSPLQPPTSPFQPPTSPLQQPISPPQAPPPAPLAAPPPPPLVAPRPPPLHRPVLGGARVEPAAALRLEGAELACHVRRQRGPLAAQLGYPASVRWGGRGGGGGGKAGGVGDVGGVAEDVIMARSLGGETKLDVGAVVSSLSRLFDRGMLQRAPPPPQQTAMEAAAAHLLACFKEVSIRPLSSSYTSGLPAGRSQEAGGADAGSMAACERLVMSSPAVPSPPTASSAFSFLSPPSLPPLISAASDSAAPLTASEVLPQGHVTLEPT